MMEFQERQLHEITEHEAWFAQRLESADRISTEHLKLRVRVEIGELWLARRLNDADAQSPPGKPATLSSLMRDTKRTRRWAGLRLVGWAAAAAAVILLAVNVPGPGKLPRDSGFHSGDFEEWGAADEIDAQLEEIEEDLAFLSEWVAQGDGDEWGQDLGDL